MNVPSNLWPRGAKPRAVCLSVRSDSILDPARVLPTLREAGGAGWVCYTDRVVATDDASTLPDGMVLSAELVTPGGASVQLRQHGDGWMLTRLQESDEGVDALWFEELFESSRPGGPWRMRYRCYWRLEARAHCGTSLESWQPWVAGFQGWEMTAGGEV